MHARLPTRVTGALAGTAVVALAVVVLLAARRPAPPVAARVAASLPAADAAASAGSPGGGGGGEVPWWLLLPALVVLLLGVVALVVATRQGLLGGARTLLPETGHDETGAGRATARLAPTADDALSDALDTLERGGDPREVVVACWVRIETAAEAAGVGRRPAETASDVARRWLARSPDHAAVDDLATLYHLARYSTHPLDDTHRARARAALRGALGSSRTTP